ncbi:putative Adenylate/guanylate cyclase, partial [Balamuthia mandrillaris]
MKTSGGTDAGGGKAETKTRTKTTEQRRRRTSLGIAEVDLETRSGNAKVKVKVKKNRPRSVELNSLQIKQNVEATAKLKKQTGSKEKNQKKKKQKRTDKSKAQSSLRSPAAPLPSSPTQAVPSTPKTNASNKRVLLRRLSLKASQVNPSFQPHPEVTVLNTGTREVSSSNNTHPKHSNLNEPNKELLVILATFLPHAVLERFREDPTPLKDFETSHFYSTILFIDISGFTSMTERLTAYGHDKGSEQMVRHLNGYFSALVDMIQKYGGDVITFAG